MVHVDPVQNPEHVQVLGPEHQPPLKHPDGQVAKQRLYHTKCLFVDVENLRVVHVDPVQNPEHVQTPGLEHQPPLKHPDGQTAENKEW